MEESAKKEERIRKAKNERRGRRKGKSKQERRGIPVTV